VTDSADICPDDSADPAGSGGTAPAVRLRGITKTYPGVVANDDIDLDVAPGSIHGLLGENGAGKSTLMKILFGLAHPDTGTIEVGGETQVFRSPADAIDRGLGMVQQHFSLIDDFTVAENLVLGDEPRRRGVLLDHGGAADAVQALADRYGFRLDARARVRNLAVGARQRVEILKALFRGAEILILDEPTASLAPQETVELFAVLRQLREQGRTVIFISHKLPEVISLCDRVTVLRDGRVAGHREVTARQRQEGPERAAVEAELAVLMVGRALPPPPERHGVPGGVVVRLDEVSDGQRLGPLSLEVRSGEIVGVAGVEGNGQTELVELLVGTRRCSHGRIWISGRDLTHTRVAGRLHAGIAHIAEDRHAAAVALGLSVADNAALGFHDTAVLAPRRIRLSPRRLSRFTRDIVRRYRVRTPSLRVAVGVLSGGNQQRLVVGREMARRPLLMIAAQPTRGLDIAAAAFVHQELMGRRDAGFAVLLVSLDLSEILTLADRVVVLHRGQIAGEAATGDVDVATLGRWMTAGRSVGSVA
jgi:simple sugar transport system ATP-binding protein